MKVSKAVTFWLEYHKANSKKNTIRAYEELICRFSYLTSFFNFIRNNFDQHFQNPCDNPIVFKSNFPAYISDSCFYCFILLWQDNTGIKIRFPRKVTSCSETKRPNAGLRIKFPDSFCQHFENVSILYKHHDDLFNTCTEKNVLQLEKRRISLL